MGSGRGAKSADASGFAVAGFLSAAAARACEICVGIPAAQPEITTAARIIADAKDRMTNLFCLAGVETICGSGANSAGATT